MASKSKNGLKILVRMPDGFEKRVVKIMEEEFIEAQKKWGVRLENDQKKKIQKYSIEQLESRVNQIAKSDGWKVDSEKLLVKVGKDTEEVIFDTTFDAETSHENNIFPIEDMGGLIQREHGGWEYVEKQTNLRRGVVPPEEFKDYLLELLEQWLRTAVFYGVASYQE